MNWSTLSKDKPEAWLYFYEHFLEVYDNRLRKLTGSYYTPPEVVEAMVNLVDQALRGPLFERAAGLASSDVTLADPAVGTGTFLLGALRKIAANVEKDQGAGAVPAAIAAAAKRLFGFELQFGPFAVAQLRLLAEMRALTKRPRNRRRPNSTSTSPTRSAIPSSRRSNCRRSSRRSPNRGARRTGSSASSRSPSSSAIRPTRKRRKGAAAGSRRAPAASCTRRSTAGRRRADWGVGAHGKHLKNLYVYFWRWATLKVFGSGRFAATGLPDTDEEGIVCFITVAGFLNGPGFEKMRDDLRRTLLGHLGDRLLAGRPSAGRADAHLPGRAAAGLHRARGAKARQG